MSRPRKFRPGLPFEHWEDAARAILADEWIYYRHKPTHPGWAKGWSILTINTFVRHGWLFRAIRNEESTS